MSHTPKDATDFTQAVNRAAVQSLPTSDAQDFEDAQRGFIGSLPDELVRSPQGGTVWNLAEFSFLDEEQPPSPSIQVSGAKRA